MDYSLWAKEYWDAATSVGVVINSLTEEIKNTRSLSKKHELNSKKEYYIDVELDMINTAKKLERRGSKNEIHK